MLVIRDLRFHLNFFQGIGHNHTLYAGAEGKRNEREKSGDLGENPNTRQFSQTPTFPQLFSYRTEFSSKRVLTENTIFAHTCLNTHSHGFSFSVFTGALVTFSRQFTHIMCFFLPLATMKQSFKRGRQEKKFLSLMFFSPKYGGILLPWHSSHYLHVCTCVHTPAY